MRPASLVACRWASLKYAGTVMTAWVTGAPKYRSALRLSWRRMCAEISGGVNSRVAQANPQHLAGLNFFDQAEGKELQFLGNIFDAAAHEALDGVNRPFRRAQQSGARPVADHHRGPGAIASRA